MPSQSTSTNVPTLLALSSPLFKFMGEKISARQLPSTFSSPDPYTVERGKTALTFSKGLFESLQKLSERELSYLLELVPRVFTACFTLARQDFLASGLLHGQFYFARANKAGNPSHLVRLAKALGYDPTCSVALRNIKRAVAVLNGATITRTYKSKGKLRQKVYAGLVELSGEAVKVKGKHLETDTRGGTFFVASIHPELFELAIPSGKRTRFIPIPDTCLTLDNKAFNTSLAILAQLTLRKVGEQELKLSESRLLTDAALRQTTQSSSARAKDYLTRSIDRLVELGLITARKLSEAGSWLISKIPTALKQGSLNKSKVEQGKFERQRDLKQGSLNKPPDKRPSEGSDFVRACQNLAKVFSSLSKNSQKELLGESKKTFLISQSLDSHEKGSRRAPGQRISLQIQLL